LYFNVFILFGGILTHKDWRCSEARPKLTNRSDIFCHNHQIITGFFVNIIPVAAGVAHRARSNAGPAARSETLLGE
jgi:hypothetical protein